MPSIKLSKLKLFVISILCYFASCRSDTLKSEEGGGTTTFITHDTIPNLRDSISKRPVATYTSKGNKLQVKVYELKNTFQFLMTMNYQFLDEKDTLRIPNFGIYPVIKLRPGSDGKSCIVGFIDTKNNFREYKLVTVKTGNLQVKVLKRYYAGYYRTEYLDTILNR